MSTNPSALRVPCLVLRYLEDFGEHLRKKIQYNTEARPDSSFADMQQLSSSFWDSMLHLDSLMSVGTQRLKCH